MDDVKNYEPTPSSVVLLAVAALTSWFILFWRKNKKAKLLPYKAEGETFLSTAERQTVRLVAKENITHDVRRFRFALPKSKPVLGLPLGKCIKVYAPNIAKGSETWNPVPKSERGPARPKDYGSGQGDFDKATGDWHDEIVRKYTPCSLDCDVDHFDLILKVYLKNTNKRFPDGKCTTETELFHLSNFEPPLTLKFSFLYFNLH